MQLPEHCTLCPRRCGANRAAGRTGYCGAGDTLLAACAALHHWEEPCLSGDPNAATGSGTVFFYRLHPAMLLLPELQDQPAGPWQAADGGAPG